MFDDINQQLDEIVERSARASSAGSTRRASRATNAARRLVDDLARERREELDELPPDLAGRVGSSSSTTGWTTTRAQRFEELMQELRKQLLDNMFNQMAKGCSEMSPEQLQRTKDMLADLNQMLEQREEGDEPDFAGFMERYGDMFPGNPQSLDELLEQMAASMAAMQRLLNSMTPEQRGPAAAAERAAARGHGPALADGRARAQPAERVPADGLGPGR